MLNVDISLSYPGNFDYGLGVTGQRCGPSSVKSALTGLRNRYGCTPNHTRPPNTTTLSRQYAANNSLFLHDFAAAFVKMVCVGYGVPEDVDGATASGKLGKLTAIDLTTC